MEEDKSNPVELARIRDSERMLQLTVNTLARFSRSRSLSLLNRSKELAEDGVKESEKDFKMTSCAGLKFQAETRAGERRKRPVLALQGQKEGFLTPLR